MEFPVITNFNINEFSEFIGPKPKDCPSRDYSIKKINDEIIFKSNFIACPCIYYVKSNDLFCYSFDVDSVVNFANEHDIKLTDTFDNLEDIDKNIRAHIKTSVMKNYKYNVSYIDDWETVTIDNKGNVTLLERFPIDNLFKCGFNDKEFYTKLNLFISKYRKYIGNLINDKLFIPSITGGLDTRYLTGLFKGREKDIEYYYLKSVKPDGKSDVDKGNLEVSIAEQVIHKLGINATRVEKLDDKYTMSGMFNENANSYDNPNDPEYITKIIQHSYSNKNNYGNKVMPFIDNDYLQFKQDGEFMRVLLTMLLTPELVFIPVVSGTCLYNQFPEGYCFTQLEKVNSVCTLLNHWGNDKVNKLRGDN